MTSAGEMGECLASMSGCACVPGSRGDLKRLLDVLEQKFRAVVNYLLGTSN